MISTTNGASSPCKNEVEGEVVNSKQTGECVTSSFYLLFICKLRMPLLYFDPLTSPSTLTCEWKKSHLR